MLARERDMETNHPQQKRPCLSVGAYPRVRSKPLNHSFAGTHHTLHCGLSTKSYMQWVHSK